MQEAFLYYLWQFTPFTTPHLQTTDGEDVIILKKGFRSVDAGPDFLEARLKIGEVEWHGHVEMHLRASDWLAHRHQTDARYENVILHVVWEADVPIRRQDGSVIPALELRLITPAALIEQQAELLNRPEVIRCKPHLPAVSHLSKLTMLDRCVMQRLEQKAELVGNLMSSNKEDLEETAFQVLAKNFGFKLNADAFLRLAESIPIKLLKKHSSSVLQLEALLFGQAGLLHDANGEYAESLRREYDFLAHKYDLKEKALQAHHWKWLRTRPGNFPTIRLAQLAQILAKWPSVFSLLVQTTSFESLKKALQVEQSAYWQQHYLFEKPLAKPLYSLGEESILNLIINSAVPLLVFYAHYSGDNTYLQRALHFLEQIPAEKNHIVSAWATAGVPLENAHQTQGGIELYRQFCEHKKCLSCTIGIEVLKQQIT